MATFQKIAREVKENAPQILALFDEVTQEEPWIHLPQGYKTETLAGIIRHVVDLSLLDPGNPERCRTLLYTGAHHGRTRQTQAFSDTFLLQEMYLLRQSIWAFVRRCDAAHTPLTFEAILRIDMALSLTTKAALRGYHHDHFESRGQWPGTLEDLTSDWRAPPPVQGTKEDLPSAE